MSESPTTRSSKGFADWPNRLAGQAIRAEINAPANAFLISLHFERCVIESVSKEESDIWVDSTTEDGFYNVFVRTRAKSPRQLGKALFSLYSSAVYVPRRSQAPT